MRSDEEILGLHKERRRRQSRALQVGELITRIYNGDADVTLPELERNERVSIANLILEGIEQYSIRVASTMPTIMFPPGRDSRTAKKRANDKKLTVQAWHHDNRLPRKMRRRARHLAGLASSPVYLRPGDGIPTWEIREPLQTFPSPGDPDDLVPHDCIFAFRRPFHWLLARYGEQLASYPRDRAGNLPSGDKLIDVLQYCDADEFVLLAVAATDDSSGGWSPAPETAAAIRLQRVPNPTGRPTVVVPGRISMARLQGQFDQMIGMYEAQGYVWAMHLHALKRAIFAEEWLEQRPGETAEIKVQADPYEGVVGVVAGGQIREVQVNPNVQTLQTLSLQERNQRLTGLIPAELGGESPTNVRTARRGSQVLGSAIDYPVQEAQEILADSMTEENLIAIDIARTYWPSTEKTLIVPFADKPITYTPEITFDGDARDAHMVSYSLAGVDTAGLVVEWGQRVGMGTASHESFMEIDPAIKDVSREKNRLNAEALELAHLTALQQLAAAPDGPYQPADFARLVQLVREEGKAPYEAEIILQREIQERQQSATEGQLPPEQMQPGLAMPGAPGTAQAAQPPPEGIPGANPDQQKLAQLMGTLFNSSRNPAPVGGPG